MDRNKEDLQNEMTQQEGQIEMVRSQVRVPLTMGRLLPVTWTAGGFSLLRGLHGP
jgi:hypothetical protein